MRAWFEILVKKPLRPKLLEPEVVCNWLGADGRASGWKPLR